MSRDIGFRVQDGMLAQAAPSITASPVVHIAAVAKSPAPSPINAIGSTAKLSDTTPSSARQRTSQVTSITLQAQSSPVESSSSTPSNVSTSSTKAVVSFSTKAQTRDTAVQSVQTFSNLDASKPTTKGPSTMTSVIAPCLIGLGGLLFITLLVVWSLRRRRRASRPQITGAIWTTDNPPPNFFDDEKSSEKRDASHRRPISTHVKSMYLTDDEASSLTSLPTTYHQSGVASTAKTAQYLSVAPSDATRLYSDFSSADPPLLPLKANTTTSGWTVRAPSSRPVDIQSSLDIRQDNMKPRFLAPPSAYMPSKTALSSDALSACRSQTSLFSNRGWDSLPKVIPRLRRNSPASTMLSSDISK